MFDAPGSQAAKDASASNDKLIELFSRIEHFFRRLDIYTGITPTTVMTDIIIEIMMEVLTILAIATKEVKRGRLSELISRIIDIHSRLTLKLEKYIRKLAGSTDIEDSLERLDKLTQEEARMASAELLKMTSIVDGKVMGVDDRVVDAQEKVQDVRGDVQGVHSVVQDICFDVQGLGNEIQVVDDKVQGIGSDVKEISSELRGVEGKLDQVNGSSSLCHILITLSADGSTGNQLRDSLFRWLSPPDTLINHNIASKVHHNGTAQWFLQGSIFNQWKSTEPFLWIHGKRALFFAFHMQRPLIISCFYSRFREKCRLVCSSSTHSAVVKLTSSIQFFDYTRYHGFAQRWEGMMAYFYFDFRDVDKQTLHNLLPSLLFFFFWIPFRCGYSTLPSTFSIVYYPSTLSTTVCSFGDSLSPTQALLLFMARARHLWFLDDGVGLDILTWPYFWS